MKNSKKPLWLDQAIRCPSPNYDGRPESTDINLLVIHNISLPPQQFGGPWIERFFLNQLDKNDHPYFKEIADLKVSAHLLIRRTGELIQFVPLEKRAWHAGISCFNTQEQCNDFSIGIELEGADDIPYTESQYAQLIAVTQEIQKIFPAISKQQIKGHNDIAPDRKTDPGASFDWKKYLQQL